MGNDVNAADNEVLDQANRYLEHLAAAPMPRITGWASDAPRRARARQFVVGSVGLLGLAVISVGFLVHRHLPISGGAATATASPKPTLCPPGSGPTSVPDNASDADRGAEYQQAQDWQAACIAAWQANLDVSSLNLSSLPHLAPGQVDYQNPPYTTLSDAVKGAQVAVVAKVLSVEEVQHHTIFNLQIGQTIKGSVGSSLVLVGQEELAPATLPPSGVAISGDITTGFPLPGDRIVVLGAVNGGEITAEPYSGLYFLKNGMAAPLPANPFASSVDGVSETALLNDLAAAAQR
jgi:hypothetical protein